MRWGRTVVAVAISQVAHETVLAHSSDVAEPSARAHSFHNVK